MMTTTRTQKLTQTVPIVLFRRISTQKQRPSVSKIFNSMLKGAGLKPTNSERSAQYVIESQTYEGQLSSLQQMVSEILTKEGNTPEKNVQRLIKKIESFETIDQSSVISDAIEIVLEQINPEIAVVARAQLEADGYLSDRPTVVSTTESIATRRPSVVARERRSSFQDIRDSIFGVGDIEPLWSERVAPLVSAYPSLGEIASRQSVVDACNTWIESAKLLAPRDNRGFYNVAIDALADRIDLELRIDLKCVNSDLHPKMISSDKADRKIVKDFQNRLGTGLSQLLPNPFNMTDEEFEASVKLQLKTARSNFLNRRTQDGFQPITVKVEINRQEAGSYLTPSRVLFELNGSQIVFDVGTQGISSGSSLSRHGTNFWESRFEFAGQSVTMYRHGINSAYGEKSDQKRQEKNLSRTNEYLVSMLSSEQIKAGRRGETIQLNVSSVSLVALTQRPDQLMKYGEGEMFKDQRQAFEAIQALGQLTLGDGSVINANLDISICNFGTNAVSLHPLAITEWDDELNGAYMAKLYDRVGQWINQNPDDLNAELVGHLRAGVQTIFDSGAYKNAENDPYKLVARLLLLNALIGVKSAVNCKSGKDRTSMAEAEAKALFVMWHLGMMPDPEGLFTGEQLHVYRTVLANCGAFEVQKANTGAAGYKIGDSAEATGLNARMGKDFCTLLQGLSKNFQS